MSVNDFKTKLYQGELNLAPLRIKILSTKITLKEPKLEVDALLEITWRNLSCRYAVALKNNAKPQTITYAKAQVIQYAQATQAQPMILAPYLSTKKLDELLSEGISALDFCGNGVVEAPNRFLFYKTGNPNKYPDSTPIVSAYAGDASLVARTLFLIREFQAISDIQTAIKQRCASLALGTVSKALQRLESDLVIERPTRNSIRVIQPEKILDGLLNAYQAPKIENTWTGKVAMSMQELQTQFQTISREQTLIRTGQSSASEYATWAGEPILTFYCRTSPPTLLQQLNADAKETLAFPNLRLLQTQDQRPFFDPQKNLAASPVQTWLEMASGDKRQKEAAVQIKQFLLQTRGT